MTFKNQTRFNEYVVLPLLHVVVACCEKKTFDAFSSFKYECNLQEKYQLGTYSPSNVHTTYLDSKWSFL